MTRRELLGIVAVVTVMAACQRDAGSNGPVDSPAGAVPPPAAAVPVTTRPRVVALGDSLTAGLGLAPEQSWPSLVQAKIAQAGLDVEVVNAGVSGDTTAGGLRRLDWALDGDVKVLVIELGANDGLRGLPADQMWDPLESTCRHASLSIL